MSTPYDVHGATKRSLSGQVKSDEPDVNGKEVNIGEDQVETSHNKKRILRAIRLGQRSSRPGDVRTHAVKGVDPDQRSSRSLSYGPRQARTSSAHEKRSPNSFSQEQTVSSVKVAAAPSDIRKLRNLKADKTTVSRYQDIILSAPVLVSVPVDELPMRPFPSNDSVDVIRELDVIEDTQATQPLTESVMDLAAEEPTELFKRACHALGVPVDDHTAPMLIQDLRRIALSLKYVHLRPRPHEIAPYHNRYVILEQPDPYDDTPSYPSVQATIGYGLANMYAEMYPQFNDEFMNVGDVVALQRVQSGRHFPSDNEYAKMIADFILGARDV